MRIATIFYRQAYYQYQYLIVFFFFLSLFPIPACIINDILVKTNSDEIKSQSESSDLVVGNRKTFCLSASVLEAGKLPNSMVLRVMATF